MSLFDIISVVDEGWLCPDSKTFLCIPTSAADAAAVNLKGIKTFLANGFITSFINSNLVFGSGPSNLPKNPPYCI